MLRKVLKWIGIGIGVLLIVLIVAVVILSIFGGNHLNKTYAVEPDAVTIPSDEESIARGEMLVQTLCVGCHGDDLGGDSFIDIGGLATVYAPNLTPGKGGVSDLTDNHLILSIRHGIRSDGTPLFIMPAEIFNHMSAQDLSAVIAYLRSLPPVDNDLPAPEYSIIARAVIGTGLFGEAFPADNIDHHKTFVTMPEISENEAYGEYLTLALGCTTCHTESLKGGKKPPADPGEDVPLSADLTQSGDLANWSEADFFAAMRTGVTPDGHMMNTDYMPWTGLSHLHDTELRALWLYLQTL